MEWIYTDIQRLLPPLGEWVTVRVVRKSVHMSPYDYFNFAKEEYRAKLIFTEKALLWKFEHVSGYRFPLEAVKEWLEENSAPIESRFEILDL